jgi:SWI/SNF-related matrix-associated actin-dependent regulator of chromatin subfamily A3
MGLVPLHYRQRATELKESIALLGPEEGASLLGHLEGAFKSLELVECAVCMNALEEKDAVILRKCEHIFCQSCLEQIANHLCPFCREPYSPEDMIKKECAEAAAKRGKIDAVEEIALHGRSPKVQAVLDDINEMQPDEKGVVFSQWTSMLDIVAAEFSDLGITFTRIDGTMNASSRIQAMKAFETERTDSIQTPRFILCSLSKY